MCDPLKKDIIELGEIERDKILDVFNRFPWSEALEKQLKADPESILFSPSLEFRNNTTSHGICISIVPTDSGSEMYIFYRRPKTISKFFGLIKYKDHEYTSDRTRQTLADAREAVIAFINDDIETLENRWG